MDWELLRWFGRAIEKMNLVDYGIELSRPESAGFRADFAFAKIMAQTEDEGSKEIHLICKYGKRRPYREGAVFPKVYEREVFFYDRILPAFQKLAKAKCFLFDSVPTCYATILNENEEVVILENLIRQGFKMYPIGEPMTLEHMRLVLDEYAKFHAVSFAFREQRREEFKNLTANYSNVMKKNLSKWLPFIEICANKMYGYLMEAGEAILANKFKTQFLDIGCTAILDRSFEINPEECIIIHTDANNNNFLFKYDEKDSGKPIKAVIMDFQLSILHSPVIDVMVFMSYVAAKEQITEYEKMLEFYYERLAIYLIQLGSHIDTCFPLETFKRHLDRYSCYVLLLLSASPMAVVDRESLMDLDEDGDVADLEPDFRYADVKEIVTERILPLMKKLLKT